MTVRHAGPPTPSTGAVIVCCRSCGMNATTLPLPRADCCQGRNSIATIAKTSRPAATWPICGSAARTGPAVMQRHRCCSVPVALRYYLFRLSSSFSAPLQPRLQLRRCCLRAYPKTLFRGVGCQPARGFRIGSKFARYGPQAACRDRPDAIGVRSGSRYPAVPSRSARSRVVASLHDPPRTRCPPTPASRDPGRSERLRPANDPRCRRSAAGEVPLTMARASIRRAVWLSVNGAPPVCKRVFSPSGNCRIHPTGPPFPVHRGHRGRSDGVGSDQHSPRSYHRKSSALRATPRCSRSESGRNSRTSMPSSSM